MSKFDPSDFYKLAKSLLSNFKLYNEAVARTVIGRAYYAAFLHAREKVSISENEKKGVHWKVREALKKMRKPHISGKLFELFRLREKADYRLNIFVKKEEAEKALQLAQDIINKLVKENG